MTLYRLFAAFVLSFIAIPAAAQTIAQAAPTSQIVASSTSPSGTLKVDVTLNPEGRVGYAVTHEGRPVISESRLGFLFTDAPEMLRNFALAEQSTRMLLAMIDGGQGMAVRVMPKMYPRESVREIQPV